VDWPAIGTLTEVTVVVNRIGDADSAVGTVSPDTPNGTTGIMTSLGTLGGPNSSAYGLNDAGQVVSAADTGFGNQHAFLTQGGVMQDLGTLPAFPDGSWANDINNAGQVVGSSLFGGAGMDWFFIGNKGKNKDKVSNQAGGEVTTTLNR
jgi:probable HAF family extracellular repeat protein